MTYIVSSGALNSTQTKLNHGAFKGYGYYRILIGNSMLGVSVAVGPPEVAESGVDILFRHHWGDIFGICSEFSK